MSVFKTTFSRALNAYPSDHANIPFPTVITSGTNTSANVNTLTDSSADFINDNIKAGDIVYNVTNGTSATVIKIKDADQLDLNADIFNAGGENYIIYQASPQTGLSNQGCYLYIGESDVTYQVITIGGDNVFFPAPIRGSILPVQVIKFISGGSAIALW